MIDLATLKMHLQISPDTATDDALLLEMEAAAVTFMQNETGCYFGPVAELTEVLSSIGLGPISLQADPIPDSVDTPFLLERRTTVAGDYEAADAADYEIDGQLIYPLVSWTPAQRAVRVTYWGGYEEGDEPADVRQAVRELVTRMYEKRLPTVAEVSDSVREIIRAYRIVSV